MFDFLGGANTLLVFIPFLFIGGGLAFVSMAAGDRRQKKNRSIRVLPVGAQHPLSHVRPRLKGVPQPTRHQEQRSRSRHRSEPPWLKQV